MHSVSANEHFSRCSTHELLPGFALAVSQQAQTLPGAVKTSDNIPGARHSKGCKPQSPGVGTLEYALQLHARRVQQIERCRHLRAVQGHVGQAHELRATIQTLRLPSSPLLHPPSPSLPPSFVPRPLASPSLQAAHAISIFLGRSTCKQRLQIVASGDDDGIP